MIILELYNLFVCTFCLSVYIFPVNKCSSKCITYKYFYPPPKKTFFLSTTKKLFLIIIQKKFPFLSPSEIFYFCPIPHRHLFSFISPNWKNCYPPPEISFFIIPYFYSLPKKLFNIFCPPPKICFWLSSTKTLPFYHHPKYFISVLSPNQFLFSLLSSTKNLRFDQPP